VVFDLGGVVFRYLPERRLAMLAELTGRSTTQIRKTLMDSGYSRSCDAGRLDVEGAYREGIRLLGQRLSLDRFAGLWTSAFEPDQDVWSIARRLKLRLPLAMLTNNSTLVRLGLESRYPALLELFRPRLFSAEAGLLKPDPRLFRTLLDLLGQPPERVLYVDDEPACADAAAALGMQVIRFSGAAALESALIQRRLLA
jgi:FMN phosphatase YigB (HAD superfamily)